MLLLGAVARIRSFKPRRAEVSAARADGNKCVVQLCNSTQQGPGRGEQVLNGRTREQSVRALSACEPSDALLLRHAAAIARDDGTRAHMSPSEGGESVSSCRSRCRAQAALYPCRLADVAAWRGACCMRQAMLHA